MSNVVYLKGKFSAPLVSTIVVSRSRLNHILNNSVDRQFHTLIAPAGYGKTTLMMDWVKQENKKVVWISLEDSDNEPHRFWKGILSAFAKQGYHTPTCQALLDNLNSEEDITRSLTLCVNEIESVIEQSGDSVVLVLDDMHQLVDPKTILSFAQVLRFLPCNIGLYLLSRERLPSEISANIPVNQTIALGPEELAFSLAEAKQYLGTFQKTEGKFRQPVSAPSALAHRLEAIWHEFEGWPIFLCAMVNRMFNQTWGVSANGDLFSSCPEYQDYVCKEVLNYLPENMRALVQQLSLVSRFNREFIVQCLCPSNGADNFQQLIRHNGLVARVPNSSADYSIRRPIKEYFRHQVEWNKTESGLATFSKALRWYLAHGHLMEAITLCVESSYWQSAIHMIEAQYKNLVIVGNWSTIAQWYAQIPNHIVQKRPIVLMLLAQKALFECAPGKSQGYLQQAEDILNTELNIDHPDGLYGVDAKEKLLEEISNLNNSINRLYTDHDLISDGTSVKSDCLAGMPLLDVYQKALKSFYLNQYEDAKSILMQLAQQALDEQHGILPQIIALLGWIHYLTGDLEKWNIIATSWKQRVAGLETASHPMAWISSSMILTHLERGEVDQATWCLEQSSVIQGLSVPRDMCFNVMLAHTAFETHRQQWDQAERFLKEAEHFSQDLPQVVLQSFYSIPALKADLLLAKGRKEEAIHSLEINGGSYQSSSFAAQHEAQVKAEILLAQGQLKKALNYCEQVKQWSESHKADTILLRSKVTEALILQKLKKEQKAIDTFQEALSLGRIGGSVQPFKQDGSEMKQLLVKSQQIARYPAYLKKLVDLHGGKLDQNEEQVNLSSLSNKEKQILELLSKGMSNPEIAENLCRSLGTVKIHVHNIYRKLGAANRVSAINKYLAATA